MNKVQTIMTVIHYIEEHLGYKLDLTSIAQAVGYSKYHLHRMFVEITGLTIHDYVQRRQLTEAAKMLVTSQQSIIDIALMAGYESQQAFTNVFKQMYKCSPLEYRVKKEFYPLQLKFNLYNPISQITFKHTIQNKITYATLEDIPLWMNLVYLIIDGYPHFHEEEYLQILKLEIRQKHAFILKNENIAIAIMIFHSTNGNIDFFGIHPLYRKLGIAQMFLKKITSQMPIDQQISITTFREGDKADIGYRQIYKDLGFVEAELLMEFGYPTQRFVLSPSKDMYQSESTRRMP